MRRESGEQFDALAKALAGQHSRRSILRLSAAFAGSILAAPIVGRATALAATQDVCTDACRAFSGAAYGACVSRCSSIVRRCTDVCREAADRGRCTSACVEATRSCVAACADASDPATCLTACEPGGPPCAPEGAPCAVMTDCCSGLCVNGACQLPCASACLTNADCEAGEFCINGCCVFVP